MVKSGGRQIGTPNKVTAVQREFIQSLLDSQNSKIEAELNSLKGKEYLSVILSLMEFTVPKLSRVIYRDENEFNGSGITRITVQGAKEYLRELEESV